MSRRPLFSVIVPTYNHAPYLGAALDSVLGQTFTDWEMVIVNDGSTDHTRDIIDAYESRDHRVRGFHKENGGVGSALNEALRRTNGYWICWLSSDDLYEPEALAIHYRAILENPGIPFFHSNYSTLDEARGVKTSHASGWQSTAPPRNRQIIQWFQSTYVHGNSFTANRSVFEDVGVFSEGYHYAQDFDMWLRVAARFPLQYLPAHTCITRTHPGQTTNTFPEACFLDSARACIEFLNRTDFRSLFPGLDLNTSTGAAQALQDSLQIALNPGAVMYCGGVVCPAFLSRIREWLTRWAPSGFRTAVAGNIGQIVGEVERAPFPAEFKTAIQLLRNLDQVHTYESYDFLEAAKERASTITGSEPEKAEWLNRYVTHIQRLTPMSPSTLPPWEGPSSEARRTSQGAGEEDSHPGNGPGPEIRVKTNASPRDEGVSTYEPGAPSARGTPVVSKAGGTIEHSFASFSYNGLTYNFCYNKLDPSGLGCIREIVANNEYVLEKFANRSAVFMDIGANCGVATIILAKQNPNSIIFSFEPHTPTWHLLANNVQINNLTNVRHFNKAVSKRGIHQLSLITHPGWSGGNTTSSDMESFGRHHRNNGNIHEIPVECIDIDTICERENIGEIELLKIDCEGAEYEILYNAAVLTEGRIKNMVGEFHNLRYNTKAENDMHRLHDFCRAHVSGILKITFLDL